MTSLYNYEQYFDFQCTQVNEVSQDLMASQDYQVAQVLQDFLEEKDFPETLEEMDILGDPETQDQKVQCLNDSHSVHN